jgi:ribosomal-protein-serine acetyltransferase
MEHLVVNNDTRLETVKLSMADIIFSTIDCNREYLKTWLPFVEYTQKVSDTVKFLREITNQTPGKKNEIYSIWYKEEFAGLIGFKDTDWINRKTELGYWLTPKLEGKGIVTSCVDKLSKYAFQKLKLNRVQIKVAVGNSKSSAIPKRLGYRFEGVERAGELHNQNYHHLETYSLLKNDLIQ